MRIAQLVSNLHSVQPFAYHAIYSHVAWLTNGLVKTGHHVDLYGAGDSHVNAPVHSVWPTNTNSSIPDENIRRHYVHLLISKCISEASQYDIIHTHFSVLSGFYAPLSPVPVLNSIHSPVEESLKPIMAAQKNMRYISFSLAQRTTFPELNWVANIYHGVDTKLFTYNDQPEDYVLFMGRITEGKGVHHAIAAAKAAGLQLIIAGKSYVSEGYWHKEIEPHVDGKSVRYVGEAKFEDKIDYLRNAKALLFPVELDEVFGMAMIEAMACGTPVIGFRRGSVPEIVADGQTGYVVDTVEQMVTAIRNIDRISRQATRKRAEMLFSVEKMVTGYSRVYERILGETSYRKTNANTNKLTH